MTTTPLRLTLRQLLTTCDCVAILDCLDEIHGGEAPRPAYDRVIDVLLAKPPTTAIHPILVSYVPEEKDTDTTAYLMVHLYNQHYTPPPVGLEPYCGVHGEPIPEGCYDGDADVYHETLSCSFVPWGDLVDAEILLEDDKAVHSIAPTHAHIAAAILWELTFMGYEESEIAEKWDEVSGVVDEYFERIRDSETKKDSAP